jgi:hypothetical protein
VPSELNIPFEGVEMHVLEVCDSKTKQCGDVPWISKACEPSQLSSLSLADCKSAADFVTSVDRLHNHDTLKTRAIIWDSKGEREEVLLLSDIARIMCTKEVRVNMLSLNGFDQIVTPPEWAITADLRHDVMTCMDNCYDLEHTLVISTAGVSTCPHIDPGWTSTWFAMQSGTKVFVMWPPTRGNLQLYGDVNKKMTVDAANMYMAQAELAVFMVAQQNTVLYIPPGWCHAVWTLTDSFAVAGSFVSNPSVSLYGCCFDSVCGVSRGSSLPQWEPMFHAMLEAYLQSKIKLRLSDVLYMLDVFPHVKAAKQLACRLNHELIESDLPLFQIALKSKFGPFGGNDDVYMFCTKCHRIVHLDTELKFHMKRGHKLRTLRESEYDRLTTITSIDV